MGFVVKQCSLEICAAEFKKSEITSRKYNSSFYETSQILYSAKSKRT